MALTNKQVNQMAKEVQDLMSYTEYTNCFSTTTQAARGALGETSDWPLTIADENRILVAAGYPEACREPNSEHDEEVRDFYSRFDG